MANRKITTRQQFIDYCLRRLGHPVIQVNVSTDQLNDRIDDALEFFGLYHYEGTEKIYMKHQITQRDIDRQWIYCPDVVSFVTGVFPFDDSNSSVNMFDLRYQLRLHDLYDFTSVSYVSYEITMQHIRTLNLLFSGTPQFRFNSNLNKLYLDIDWARDVRAGEYVVIECYRKLNPDTLNLTGTVNLDSASKTIIGTGTIFDQEILEGDTVYFGSEPIQINKIKSPTEITVLDFPSVSANNVSMTIVGMSDIWNNKFMKSYATAKIKYQWALNMSKFSNIQMPGGVTFNAQTLMEEAKEEIQHLENDAMNLTLMPAEMFIG